MTYMDDLAKMLGAQRHERPPMYILGLQEQERPLPPMIRKNLWRLNPLWWWEKLEYATELHARIELFKLAFSRRYEFAVLESIWNASYFQFAIDRAQLRAKQEACRDLLVYMKYSATPQDAVEGYLAGQQDGLDFIEKQWDERGPLYRRGRRRDTE